MDESGWAVSRRGFLGAASLLPLAAMVPELLATARASTQGQPHRFFTVHQAAVIDAATRRIAPGPEDDPAETGHPGAHEADVVRYIDTMLAIFSMDPPPIFTGGPWSNRHAAGPNLMELFVRPDAAQLHAWRVRIKGLRTTYADGVKLLDSQSGGNFSTSSAQQQDQVLSSSMCAEFTAVLFEHTIEGMYSVPEYGGNAGLSGWREIGYPGDSQPKGYTAAELAEQQISVLNPVGSPAILLDNFEFVARALAAGRPRRA